MMVVCGPTLPIPAGQQYLGLVLCHLLVVVNPSQVSEENKDLNGDTAAGYVTKSSIRSI